MKSSKNEELILEWRSLHAKANMLREENKNNEAWRYYDEALHLSIKEKADPHQYFVLYYDMAQILLKEGKYHSALLNAAYSSKRTGDLNSDFIEQCLRGMKASITVEEVALAVYWGDDFEGIESKIQTAFANKVNMGKGTLNLKEPVSRQQLEKEINDLINYLVYIESEAARNKWSVAPAAYERLAKIYRKTNDIGKEVEIIERYIKHAGKWGGKDKIVLRLAKARMLLISLPA